MSKMKFTCPKNYPAMHLHRYNMLQKIPLGINAWNSDGSYNIAALAKWSLTAKLTPTERFIMAAIIMYGFPNWHSIIREGKFL